MTKMLEDAIDVVRKLSANEQNEIARLMLALANDEPPEPIDPADAEAVHEGMQQASRRQFATPDRVAKLLGRT